jgi:drug/metabolite transporter (DMT)-like permease
LYVIKKLAAVSGSRPNLEHLIFMDQNCPAGSGPFMLVAFRASFGTLGMLTIILFSNRKMLNWQKVKPWLGLFFLIGILNVVFPFVLFSLGEQFIRSGIA